MKSQSFSQRNVPYRRESFREKHFIIEFNSDFNMADEGLMSNQAKSKNMLVLQADIDSMTVRNDSIGRAYFAEAMDGPYRQTTINLSKADTAKVEEVLQKSALGQYNVDSLYQAMTLEEKDRLMTAAFSNANSTESDWNFKSFAVKQDRQQQAAAHDCVAREDYAFFGMFGVLLYRRTLGRNHP